MGAEAGAPPSPVAVSAWVAAFAAEVGGVDAGPVVVEGSRSAWSVGGAVGVGVRAVRAPVGIVAALPAEMTVRVGVGTPVADVDAVLAAHGQCVALPVRSRTSTVGGALAVGQSGIRRLGWGPVRDTVLEISAVLADGRAVRAGGPTVKNVAGYDLCRVLVGSLGTLAALAEVVLRTRPVPPAERWFRAPRHTDPDAVRAALYRPASVLWDGTTTWVLLDGHPADIETESRRAELVPDEAPSFSGLDARWSVRPSHVASLADDGRGPFLAEIGVGVVHRAVAQPRAVLTPAVDALHRRLKANFDPSGRLAPGRDVVSA